MLWKTKEAGEENRLQLMELLQQARAELPKLPEPEHLILTVGPDIPDSCILISESGPDLLGFAALSGNRLAGIYVRPQFRSQGIGRHLVGMLMRVVPHLSLDAVESSTRIFFQKLGFSETQNAGLSWEKRYAVWSDEEFIRRFEAPDLPFYEWTHRAHVRMAWIYLSRFPKNDAIERMRTGIKRLNTSNGIHYGYHETVTVAYAEIIARDMQGVIDSSFDTFIAARSHLLNRQSPPTLTHYSKELLWSQKSREEFVEPDLQPFSI